MELRSQQTLIIVLLTAVVVACPILVHRYHVHTSKGYTASCANHFKLLRLPIMAISQDYPDLVLPDTNDTRAALLTLFNEANGTDWGLDLRHPSWACPESFKRDAGIGYVYVGDGLRLKDVYEKHILILFCPGENHRGASEHCHAIALAEGLCIGSNEEMTSHLESALERGETGEIPYTRRAMTVLRDEVEKRKKS